ncbi:hypothetical protein [Streptomyces sp. NPDC017941]|uniref:hypothetical protein n=1 Tax=Streptomyces sp. NPDC017941 TaxID=3365018 RepID=UPI00379211BB
MTPEPETLATLISERAGKRGSGLPTFEQLSERSEDPVSGYRPSANHLWRIASGEDVKVNPRLLGAIAAGLSVPLHRVQAAAARQFLGLEVSSEAVPGDDDAEISVAHEVGATAAELRRARGALDDPQGEHD